MVVTIPEKVGFEGYAAGQRVAERVMTSISNELYYLHGDHLGSASKVTCGNAGCVTGNIPVGGMVSTQYYQAYGGIRNSTGNLPTDYGITG